MFHLTAKEIYREVCDINGEGQISDRVFVSGIPSFRVERQELKDAVRP